MTAIIAGIPGMAVIAIVAFFSPFVVIRKIWNHTWLDSDVILVWLSCFPIIIWSLSGWTLPGVIQAGACAVTAISVFFLRFSEKDIRDLTQHAQVNYAELPDEIEGPIDPLDPDAEMKMRANHGELTCLLFSNQEAEQAAAADRQKPRNINLNRPT